MLRPEFFILERVLQWLSKLATLHFFEITSASLELFLEEMLSDPLNILGSEPILVAVGK